jgi:hypothetical protein
MKNIVLVVSEQKNFIKSIVLDNLLKNDFQITLIYIETPNEPTITIDKFYHVRKPDVILLLSQTTNCGASGDKLYKNKNFLKCKTKIIDEINNTDVTKLGKLGEIRDKLIIEFKKINPDLIFVIGNNITTLGACFTSKLLNIEIAHLESGIRSGTMNEEEINSIVIDYITTYHFATQQISIDNLNKEKISNNIYLIDELSRILDILLLKKRYYNDLSSIIGERNMNKKKYYIIHDNKGQLMNLYNNFFRLLNNPDKYIIIKNMENLPSDINIDDDLILIFHMWMNYPFLRHNKLANELSQIESKTENPIIPYSFLDIKLKNICLNYSNVNILFHIGFNGSEVRDFYLHENKLLDWFKFEGIDNSKVKCLYQDYKKYKNHDILTPFDNQFYYLKKQLQPEALLNLDIEYKKTKKIIMLNRRHNKERFVCASFLYKWNQDINISYILTRNNLNKKDDYKSFDPLIEKYDINIEHLKNNIPLYLDSLINNDVNWNSIKKDNGISIFNNNSYFSLVFETNFEIQSSLIQQVSEKTYKPICNRMPFIIWTTTGGILKYLKNHQFKTFDAIIDESYDDKSKSYEERFDLLLTLLSKICNLSYEELDEMYKKVIPVINHNYNLLRTL